MITEEDELKLSNVVLVLAFPVAMCLLAYFVPVTRIPLGILFVIGMLVVC